MSEPLDTETIYPPKGKRDPRYPPKAGVAKPARAPRPKKHKVRLHNPDDYSGAGNKTVFESESETAARNYIKTHHPRGREVFLQTADGQTEHYSADLEAQGDDPWIEYSEDESDY